MIFAQQFITTDQKIIIFQLLSIEIIIFGFQKFKI